MLSSSSTSRDHAAPPSGTRFTSVGKRAPEGGAAPSDGPVPEEPRRRFTVMRGRRGARSRTSFGEEAPAIEGAAPPSGTRFLGVGITGSNSEVSDGVGTEEAKICVGNVKYFGFGHTESAADDSVQDPNFRYWGRFTDKSKQAPEFSGAESPLDMWFEEGCPFLGNSNVTDVGRRGHTNATDHAVGRRRGSRSQEVRVRAVSDGGREGTWACRERGISGYLWGGVIMKATHVNKHRGKGGAQEPWSSDVGGDRRRTSARAMRAAGGRKRTVETIKLLIQPWGVRYARRPPCGGTQTSGRRGNTNVNVTEVGRRGSGTCWK